MASRLVDVVRASPATPARAVDAPAPAGPRRVPDTDGSTTPSATAEHGAPGAERESAHAESILRLLLDGTGFAGARDDVAWASIFGLAQRNRVLVRVADRITRAGLRPPPAVAVLAERERDRGRMVLAVVRALADACTRQGIEFVFPKAFVHLPDVGGDIDLLVLARSALVDEAIFAGLPAVRMPRDVAGRIAGSSTYRVDGCAAVVDIHHGRLGLVGEHEAFPHDLVRNRRPILVDGVECHAPSPDDQLVLQGLQGAHDRRALRLADIVQTVMAVRRGDLDWDYILRVAVRESGLPGLSCHLACVEQIHRRLYGEDLLPPEARRRLLLGGWGRVDFRDGQHRYPMLRAGGRVYVRKLAAALSTRHWEAAGRLCLVPVVAGAAVARRLARRRGGAVGTARPGRQASGGA